MSKPVLTFVKMLGCGPCMNFFGNPSTETSPWAQIVKDPEVNSKFDLQVVEFGFDKATGKQYQRPAHLNAASAFPAFMLVDSSDKSVSLLFPEQNQRTKDSVKTWALNSLPKLAQLKASKTAQKAVAAPQPSGQPGAPRSFVDVARLPPQVRNTPVQTKAPVQVQVQQPKSPQVQVQSAPVEAKAAPPAKSGMRIIARNQNSRIVRRR